MKEQVKIIFEYTVVASSTLTLDEARDTFGLGGTPDDEMPVTLGVLAANFPNRYLATLASAGLADIDTECAFKLRQITDAETSEPLYPEP